MHMQIKHPKTFSKSPSSNDISVDPEEQHICAEVTRISKEIYRFKYGKDSAYDKDKLKKFEREVKKRIESGSNVPGYVPFA